MKFTLGSDPEVLLTNRNRFVSAIGIFEGTKDNPKDYGIGQIHHDNVMAEFNTIPAHSAKQFVDNVSRIFSKVHEIAHEHRLGISEETVGEYSEQCLSHPLAQVAGCEPDWNVYTRAYNQQPMLYETTIRCAGGHVHIGADLSPQDIQKLVKVLDLLVTIPMLKHEKPDRRELYGKAGSYRIKPYGVEYRTPSNFWIFRKERKEWLYEMVERALKTFKEMSLPAGAIMQECIDNHNTDLSEAFISAFDIPAIPI